MAKSLQDTAKDIAKNFNLDPALVCAIVEQESSWNPFAIRYEPGFFQHYIESQYAALGLPGDGTEARTRAISWGLMQVMGQTAREHGFKGFLSQLCDPVIGLQQGCTVFQAKFKAAGSDTHKALLLYNGGDNPDYPDQVLARVSKY